MTVAVTCNLSEGVVFVADSAVTIPTPNGTKVYESAEKLFQLGDRPIGVATYGLGALGARTIGSFIREFEVRERDGALRPGNVANVCDVVESLRAFFMNAYTTIVGPALEAVTQKKLAELDPAQLPALGLVVGGFSKDAYLSEVWNIVIPSHAAKGSAECVRGQGLFGSNWFASCEPIVRYVKGFDPALISEIVDYVLKARGNQPLNAQEAQDIAEMLAKREYVVPFVGMPLKEGVTYARFLAQLVVSHHQFSVGDRVVGGRLQTGTVMYRDGSFRLLDAEQETT